MTKKDEEKIIERPPVIAIMGHIDHGKSTLLDFIRKSNVVDKEAGGITQHLGSYELVHEGKDGKEHKITFLDTPGHEAFFAIRKRGASTADIAVLVVSAEDGVKPQTLEALECIKNAKMPFVVAINKIDKPGADIERTKQNLAENEIFLEGYGGHTPWTAISAKTGQGVPELLDLLLLVAELEELKGNPGAPAEGVVIESNLDPKKGITATVLIKNGTIKSGQFVVSGKSLAPLRIMENFSGKKISTATFSSPIKIIGWDTMPKVGEKFLCFEDKKSAQEATSSKLDEKELPDLTADGEEEKFQVPVIIKADTSGSLEALIYELGKIKNERAEIKILLSGVGPVSENDVKTAGINEGTLVVGFHTKIDPRAESLALRSETEIKTFEIIYKLTEWLKEVVEERTPSIDVEETAGLAKILKTFSKTKDKQIVGGKVESGEITSNSPVKIIRRSAEIGKGHIKELQHSKQKVGNVPEGEEFGMQIESKIEIVPGDKIEVYKIVKK